METLHFASRCPRDYCVNSTTEICKEDLTESNTLITKQFVPGSPGNLSVIPWLDGEMINDQSTYPMAGISSLACRPVGCGGLHLGT